MTKPIELTTTIDPHVFPRLYAYLKEYESGRPRASVLKRLAEDYLHAMEQVALAATAQPAGPSKQSPGSHDQEPDLSRPDDAIANSLGQFRLA